MNKLRYIGPFFRMNSLSQKEISGQLFYLSKEAIRTLVLESKCGLVSSIKSYKRMSSSIDITTLNSFSPLLCIYKKSSPNYIHSKNSNGFDEDTFKKDINPTTNALMTLNVLELISYYRHFENVDKGNYSLSQIYKKLAKDQLEFYSINLRNAEGVFVEKKNISENNYKGFNLVDKSKKFKFSDQAFMMIAYYSYATKFPEESISEDYKKFSLEILQMLVDFKEKLYECSFEELCKVLTAINIFYKYSNNLDCKMLIVDLTDFLINKFDEKDYYVDALDFTSLLSINLILSYKHTGIITFSDKATEILNRLTDLYDDDKEIFLKLSGKKELKYSCFDIVFYFLAFNMYANTFNNYNEYKHMLSALYKKYFINSGLIPTWPTAPTLDDYERYRGLTLNSSDMLDESLFRMPSLPSPNSIGVAPIFNKTMNYVKKKDTFSISGSSFDSYKNMFIFYMLILVFKDDFMNEVTLNTNIKEEKQAVKLDDIHKDSLEEDLEITTLDIEDKIISDTEDIEVIAENNNENSIEEIFEEEISQTVISENSSSLIETEIKDDKTSKYHDK